MAIRIGQSAEADRYRSPIFGQQQQQPQLYTSIPTGGFMGQNQIGGQSSINVFRKPRPEPTPEELEAQSLEERAMQYQKDVGEFNLGQKEADLEKRRAEADEIASGRFMLNGQAVTRAEMDQYINRVESSGAKAQDDFNRADPFYGRAKQFVNQNFAQPRPRMPGESQEQYQRRTDNYNKSTAVSMQNITQRVYNQMRENALIRSIEQFRDDPTAYLMGGGMGQRTNTIPPDELMNYLNTSRQMFQMTGGEGNFMDYLLGREGSLQRRRVVPLNSLLGRKTADELADLQYSQFTQSEGVKTNPLAVQSYLYRNSPYVERRAPAGPGLRNIYGDRIFVKDPEKYGLPRFVKGDETPIEEFREAERARVAALKGDPSYRPNYIFAGGRLRTNNLTEEERAKRSQDHKERIDNLLKSRGL